MTKRKKGKLPEIARFLYKVNLDIEATKEKAKEKGFICRLLEGQPKNKKGKNGVGEPYPLPQYEVTGNELPSNIKIELAPKTTQIYVFGEELSPPKIEEGAVSVEHLEEFADEMEAYCQQIETAEEVMNKVAVFSDVPVKFCRETRIYAKTPARYRLIINSRDLTDCLLDKIENVFQNEFNLAADEMLRGNISQAIRRLNLVLKELDFFAKSLIATARQMNDPRADRWEKEFSKLLQPLNYPMGFVRNQNSWFNLGQ